MRNVPWVLLLPALLLPGTASAGAAPGALADLKAPLPAVRTHAAERLGQAGDPAAVPGLVAALKDTDPGVRSAAASALGILRDARAVAPLALALRDPDAGVRFYAAYALGEINDARAAPALLAALGDPAFEVRDQAAWALREIGDPHSAAPIAAMLADAKTAPAAEWILRGMGPAGVVPALAGVLKDPGTPARTRAVQVLAGLKDPAALDALSAALKDTDAGVRRCAVEGLTALGGERALAPLRALEKTETDPAVRALLAVASQPAGLAAYWSFDDGSATAARDVTGRGSDGAITGCVPVAGKVGKGLRFSPGCCVELNNPTHASTAQTPFTVCAWVKPDGKDGVVIARGGAFLGWSLYLKGGVPRFGLRRDREGAPFIAAGAEPLAGGWTHLAGVAKPDRIELWVNGKLAATTKTTGVLPGDGGQGMEIGFDVGNSAVAICDHFQGVIDEVKLFTVALTPEQIATEAGQ